MLNIEELKNYLGCDNQFLADLLDKFVREAKEELENMKAALQTKNWLVVKRAAHKTLSSTRIMDLQELNTLLEQIEIDAETQKNTEQLPEKIMQAEKMMGDTFAEVAAIREKLK